MLFLAAVLIGKTTLIGTLFIIVKIVEFVYWMCEPAINFVLDTITFILTCMFWPFMMGYELWKRKENLKYRAKLTVKESCQIPLEVKLDQMINIMTALLQGNATGKEALLPGSTNILLEDWPRQVFSMRNTSGQHVGFGFFSVVKGKWTAWTAGHVLKETIGGSMWTPKGAKKLEKDLKIFAVGSFDYVGFEVPSTFAADLGCMKMVIGRTPSVNSTVSVLGYIGDKMTKCVGVVYGYGENMRFKHTCSTLQGFCGSPLIIGEKNVVGIHIEYSCMGYNLATSMDLAVVGKEMDDYSDNKYLYNEFGDLVTTTKSVWYMDGDGMEIGIGNKNFNIAHNVEETRYKMLKTIGDMSSWAETYEDEDEDVEDLKRFFANMDKKRRKEFLTKFKESSSEGLKDQKKENLPKPTEALNSSPIGTGNSARADKRKRQRESRKRSSTTQKVISVTEESLANGNKVEVHTVTPQTTNDTSTPLSKGGAGPKGTVMLSGQVWPLTPEDTAKGSSLPQKTGERLSKPSAKVVNIQKLVSRLGIKEDLAYDKLTKKELNSFLKCLEKSRISAAQ
jgi:hypothetical protein